MKRNRRGIVIVVLFLTSVAAAGQPAFEVVSVKPSAPGANLTSPGEFLPGGRWLAQGAPLGLIVRVAYELRADQLIGGPSWINTERFDIDARAAGDRSHEQILLMVRSLLADRFKLKVHTEQRTLDVYALVLAKEGQLGPGLRPSKVDCETNRVESPPPPPGQVQRPICGLRIFGNNGLRQLRAGGTNLSTLTVASGVRSDLGRPVIDSTGLSGVFDVELDYIPQQRSTVSDPPVGLPLIAAFEQQLGLKFERRKELSDVLVIDSVERPTPD